MTRDRNVASWRSALLLGMMALGCAMSVPQEPPVYLFSFFRDNGQDGLYLCWSLDGYQWTELQPPGDSFLRPGVGSKLMRDPCIARGPDGTFHMVWTTSWTRPPVVGYASSMDLLTWSPQREIPVMRYEPEARNAWAPELFYDDTTRRWLVFWSTTIPGRFPETAPAGDNEWNHRIYYTTTEDFLTFGPTRLFFDGGFNVIDATMLRVEDKYCLIVKDETKTPVKKHLLIAWGRRAEGPFGPAGPPFTQDWVEGPSAIRIGDEYFVYFDHYTKPQYYGAVKSRDLATWEDVSDRMSFPPGMRHGTVLAVDRAVIEKIEAAAKR